MSTLETTVVPEPISKGQTISKGPRGVETDEDRVQLARAFLIVLVSREIQLSSRVAGWLRTSAQRLSHANQSELAAQCLCMTAETWQLREQLMALMLRLVARRNRSGQRRVNAMQVLDQPPSPAMAAFIELTEQTAENGEPGVALEILATVEQLLADAMPLAIEIVGLDDHTDLSEAAELYRGRAQRADKLRGLVRDLARLSPERRDQLQDIRARALDSFNQIARESASLGERLDADPSFVC